MTLWNTAYLSIGSNKGDKLKNLAEAITCLRQEEKIRVTGVSGFYRTAPQNYADQDWFINGALKIETCLAPEPLLKRLKSIESMLDEEGKAFRFGPRIIDLDIVYYDTLVIKTERLELPHPRMHERCFVLKPLSDIASTQIHPLLNLSTDELLNQIKSDESQAVIPLDEEDIREIFH
jgi:2-amino-4-hydroxy-6-hydroxymethyldihydropteridine diphosphokinase